MKGTPFFAGEYSKRTGPVEERVNAWPLLYYREPALSVLWPLMDWTDDYFAFRPVFSMYGLDRASREYNVVWPLSHFEQAEHGDNWILPFFWGHEYAVGFPFYWHLGRPLEEKGGVDALLPVWCLSTDRTGYDLDLLWPVFEARSRGPERRREEGWRLWPLYGSYREGEDRYRFAAWPVAQFWWNESRDRSTHCVLPLWYRDKEAGRSLFVSLPYSAGSEVGGSSWWLVPPLAYSDSDESASRFITPLYWQGRDRKSGAGWDALVPLFYSSRDGSGSTLATLLGGGSRRGEDSWWFAVPLLSGGAREGTSVSTWWFGGLGHYASESNTTEWYAAPLCYSTASSNRWLFLSLPWSGGGTGDGSSWSLTPPVWFRSRDKAGELTLTPLYSFGKETGGEHREWSTLLPLYYHRESDRGTAFVTILGGFEKYRDGGSDWKLYPLLTGGSIRGDEGSVWVLGPMFHASWDAKAATHHLLPLYYWNGTDRTFVSAAFSQWGPEESKVSVVPPLLSVYSGSKTRSDLWTAAGAVHWSWGVDAGSRYILPVYAGDAGGKWHATPAVTMWTRDDGGYGVSVPPLLSWYTSATGRGDLWLGGALAHFSWGDERGGSHVFPLVYWNTRTSTYLSLLWSSWKPEPDASRVLVPPVLGLYERDRSGRDLWLALGLFHSGVSGGDKEKHSGHLLPLYLFDEDVFLSPLFGWNSGEGKDFVYFPTPLVGFWRNERSGMWLFPLFSWCSNTNDSSVSGNFLWGPYRWSAYGGTFGLFPLFSVETRDSAGSGSVSGQLHRREVDVNYLLWFGRYKSASLSPGSQAQEGSRKAGGALSGYSEHINRLFPLWRYASNVREDRGERESDFSLLLLLYDHHTENRPPKDGATAEYVRSRLLYRMWHYERMDDAVSLDVFPAVTYDRRGDSMRKFSFLWRALRYQRSGNERAVDLLFLPVWRTSWFGSSGN